MTRSWLTHEEDGFSMVEVIVAMSIAAIGLIGAMGAIHAADRGMRQGLTGTRARAMVESRLEAKRSARWQSILLDDMNNDGVPDVVMRDDGQSGDATAGDGIFTGTWAQDGVQLLWTLTPNRAGSLSAAGSITVEAVAAYGVGNGSAVKIKMAMVRANPTFVGGR